MAILSILYISATIVLAVSALACFAIYKIDKNAEKIEKDM
jgi:uncharacterized membrane protein YsdA (DUF1294 family)